MKTIVIHIISILLPIILCFLLYSCFLFPMNEVEYFVVGLEETKITPSDSAYDDIFGNSVSVSADGDSFVVGASEDNDNGTDSGSIYLYKWNGTTWAETKIIASDGASGDNFGRSVSITAEGNSFIVGAFGYGGIGSGFIYKWNGLSWSEAQIPNSDVERSSDFGFSVSITANGNTIAVGGSLL